MTNHPNRGKLSRNALELIATLSAGGLALTAEQQQSLGRLCRAAASYKRLQEERCNGPWWYNTPWGAKLPSAEHTAKWEEWNASVERRKMLLERRMSDAARLPMVKEAAFQGDPRGITVKLVLTDQFKHLHDSFDREGVCVPGS